MKHVAQVFDNGEDHRIVIFSDGVGAGFIPSVLVIFGVTTLEQFVENCNVGADSFITDPRYNEQFAVDNGYKLVYDVALPEGEE